VIEPSRGKSWNLEVDGVCKLGKRGEESLNRIQVVYFRSETLPSLSARKQSQGYGKTQRKRT
jgi:hypothetical protein